MSHPSPPMGPAGIAALIPHAGAMRLIDEVEAVSENAIRCSSQSHLLADNPLRSGGRLPASAAIEYAAQAAAIHGALVLSGGGAARRAFLAVASNVSWTADWLDGGQGVLTVEATRLAADGSGAQYAFRVSAGDVSAEGVLLLSLETGAG